MTDSMLKARVRMLLRHPFFATLLLKHNCVEEPSIKTLDIDGETLRYNAEFFDTLSSEEQEGVLAHEVMHTALCHHTRREHRDPKKWNKAADYAINWILQENGIKLPKGCLIDAQYKDKTAEQIYDLLPQDTNASQGQNQGQGSGQGGQWKPGDGFDGGLGDVKDFPDPQNAPSEAIKQQGNLIKAYQAAKGEGAVSGQLKRIIDEILHPKVDIETALERLLSEKARNNYSWAKPNRNYIQQGIYAPSLQNLEYGEVVISIDTSGSISQKMLNKFSAIINRIADITQNQVQVLYVDRKLKHIDIFEPGDEIKLNMHGGGGTDFRPSFEYLAKESIVPKLHLYFTDGDCTKFPPSIDHDLIWICTDKDKLQNPIIGETIYFEE